VDEDHPPGVIRIGYSTDEWVWVAKEEAMMVEPNQPLEERPEVADAVEDDVAVDAFITGGGPDADNPEFRAPGEEPADRTGEGPEDQTSAEPQIRTGADQPWDPADLAVAQGKDPTPENVEHAREELDRDGPAAIERTVP
jgi:hypothetical protein